LKKSTKNDGNKSCRLFFNCELVDAKLPYAYWLLAGHNASLHEKLHVVERGEKNTDDNTASKY